MSGPCQCFKNIVYLYAFDIIEQNKYRLYHEVKASIHLPIKRFEDLMK